MKATGQVTDWSRAYGEYRPDVLRFLTRRAWGREELAEDLTQETFVRALKARTPIRDPSKMRSYLMQVANHVFVSHVRRKGRVTSESDFSSPMSLEAHPDGEALDPLASSQVSELKQRVEELVAELPEAQRIAFRCGVLERRTYGDIAEEYGWTVAKVKSCVFRARQALMPALREFR
jgi:RNA polymerase sigma-70 factor (ECF subfamily)